MELDIPAWWAGLPDQEKLIYGVLIVLSAFFSIIILPSLLVLVGFIGAVLGFGIHIYEMSHGLTATTAPSSNVKFLVGAGLLLTVSGSVLRWLM